MIKFTSTSFTNLSPSYLKKIIDVSLIQHDFVKGYAVKVYLGLNGFHRLICNSFYGAVCIKFCVTRLPMTFSIFWVFCYIGNSFKGLKIAYPDPLKTLGNDGLCEVIKYIFARARLVLPRHVNEYWGIFE